MDGEVYVLALGVAALASGAVMLGGLPLFLMAIGAVLVMIATH